MSKSELQRELPASVRINHLIKTGQFFLQVTRTVDFDMNPLKDGYKWNPEFVGVEISEFDALRLQQQLGVAILSSP